MEPKGDTKTVEATNGETKCNGKIQKILDRTGYTYEANPNELHYGPPPNWEGKAPPHTHQVFIGRLARDVMDSDLIELIEEKVGENTIYDVRLLMDTLSQEVVENHEKRNRGFAFVTFTTKEAVKKCREQLDHYEIRQGKRMRVNQSTPNVHLFVTNLPKTKDKDEIFEEFKNLTEGLVDVLVFPSRNPPDSANDQQQQAGQQRRNRGFAFLEYENHLAAAAARRKLNRPGLRVWNRELIVEWAVKRDEPDEETMAKVKALYVRNVSPDITEDDLRKAFSAHGQVERVKKVRDFAFIHFADRPSALKAMQALNRTQLADVTIDIELAKPMQPMHQQPVQQHPLHQHAHAGMLGGGGVLATGWPGHHPWGGAAAWTAYHPGFQTYGPPGGGGGGRFRGERYFPPGAGGRSWSNRGRYPGGNSGGGGGGNYLRGLPRGGGPRGMMGAGRFAAGMGGNGTYGPPPVQPRYTPVSAEDWVSGGPMGGAGGGYGFRGPRRDGPGGGDYRRHETEGKRGRGGGRGGRNRGGHGGGRNEFYNY